MSQPPVVRLECLSEATLPGAHAVKLAFLGAGKAFCLVCPYSWEPESLESFARFYRLHPETMRGTAVAVREDTGEVVGVIATATHGQPRSPEDTQMHATNRASATSSGSRSPRRREDAAWGRSCCDGRGDMPRRRTARSSPWAW